MGLRGPKPIFTAEERKVRAREATYRWASKNPDKAKENTKKWREKNKKHFSENLIKWKEKNKERVMATRRIRDAKRRNDTFFKLKENIRGRILVAFRRAFVKKNDRTVNLLGCSTEFLKGWLENQFEEGMTWENYGNTGWNVDHIVPLASANTEEELKKLFHYTNLQPMWAKENISKSSKLNGVRHRFHLAA